MLTRPSLRRATCLLLLQSLLWTPALSRAQQTGDIVELPLVSGWYDGKVVRYVTTDVSDRQAAVEMGANYVPRLANALNHQPQPGQPSAVERIYGFANQGSVLPSLPAPIGAANANPNYSPLWQVYKVRWLPGRQIRLLKSEEEVLAAEQAGDLSIEKTNLVVNCPVIFTAEHGALPQVRIHLANQDPEP